MCASVQEKFESVYLHVIKKHPNNLSFKLVIMNWDFVVLSLIYFRTASIPFDFEKFKPEQALRTLDWKDSLFTRNSLDLSKCLKFCLCFQIRQLQRLKF